MSFPDPTITPGDDWGIELATRKPKRRTGAQMFAHTIGATISILVVMILVIGLIGILAFTARSLTGSF